MNDNGKQELYDYKDVWVFTEHMDGRIRGVTLELLGKGRELADCLDVRLVAILLGNNVEPLCSDLIRHGADKVILVNDPMLEQYQTGVYADLITQHVRKFKPEIFLIGATHLGRDLAPRLSARIGTGLTADCTGLEIDRETRLLIQTLPAFGGNIIASIVTPHHRPQMATVRPRVMIPLPEDKKRKGEILRVPQKIDPKSVMVKILDVVKEGKKRGNPAEADFIVAGGRGVRSGKGFELLEKLAEALGGEVGATRDAVEAGWISSDHMVGQTGYTVRPKVYIACGISGSVQHIAGMKESDIIIAINTDPNAPIFDVSDYGIVADLHQVLPMLTAAIKQLRS